MEERAKERKERRDKLKEMYAAKKQKEEEDRRQLEIAKQDEEKRKI